MGLRDYLFGFKGRINRAKQWLFILVVSPISLAYELIAKTLLNLSWKDYVFGLSKAGFGSALGREVYLAMFPLWLIMLIPSLAITVKRLHDRNKSGWWAVLFIYVPWMWSIFGNMFLGHLANSGKPTGNLIPTIGQIAYFIVAIWAFVELYCLRGTVGVNRFGPDPLGPAVDHVFE